MNELRAVFPGSFDPLTRGHVDIIERALSVFPKVLVGVLNNSSKQPFFSVEERVVLISQECARFGARVEVKSFKGLLVDFASKEGCQVILRGLRAVSDYDYETQMALMNRQLKPTIETLFLAAREENSYVSSTIVKQVFSHGGDVSALVPAIILKAMQTKS